MIRGVKFVSIPVSDQDRALAFYTDVLGFRLLTDQPFSDKQRWLELGIPGAETRVVLFQFGDKLQPGGQLNIALWTDDLEATARELKAKGVEFVMEPKRTPYGGLYLQRRRRELSGAELQVNRGKRIRKAESQGPQADCGSRITGEFRKRNRRLERC